MKPDIQIKTPKMELSVASYFSWRQNLIVPNVYWGLGLNYEADLVIVKDSQWAYEVEIKISLSDLKADKTKRHTHDSNKFQRLYFAIPEKLLPNIELIPEKAGIILIKNDNRYGAQLLRVPKINKLARKLTDIEILKLYKLMAMRTWNLKHKLHSLTYKHKST